MKLSKTQQRVILAISQGYTLKSHRYLDGAKLYKLHALTGAAETIRWTTVEALKERRLIDIAFQKNILTKIGPIFKIGPIWHPQSQKHYLKDYITSLIGAASAIYDRVGRAAFASHHIDWAWWQ